MVSCKDTHYRLKMFPQSPSHRVSDWCSGGTGCIAPRLSDYQPTVSCPLDVHTEREGNKEWWRGSREPGTALWGGRWWSATQCSTRWGLSENQWGLRENQHPEHDLCTQHCTLTQICICNIEHACLYVIRMWCHHYCVYKYPCLCSKV